MKNTNKRGIKHLADICVTKGIEHAVFSPGSRCAPLVMAFHRHPNIKTYNIVDERAAAFFALGIAQQTRQPVVLVCTSGTASLNYAPAIAEAYYQRIPLLVLTADRPAEWIDQADMQSIRQHQVYHNYIKKSFQLPQHEDDVSIWHNDRIISEAINGCVYPDFGPVHINVPLQEPLYEEIEYPEETTHKCIDIPTTVPQLSAKALKNLKEIWGQSERKLILVGLHQPSPTLHTILHHLCEQDKSVVVFKEYTSNLPNDSFFYNIDRLLDSYTEEQKEKFRPDLVLTIGGMVVSKKIKLYLRKYSPKHHWHFDKTAAHFDTFQSLTHVLPIEAYQVLKHFKHSTSTATYQNDLKEFDDLLEQKQNEFIKKAPYSDFQIMETVLGKLPDSSLLQLGNSTPVRYANLFNIDARRNIIFHANRGVGGIDGAMSTAAGAASTTDKITTHISGDLSFFYDSNALWNRHLPANLRIILINNNGGNIFRIIKGPDRIEELEDFFEVKHLVQAQKLVENFGLYYYFCSDKATLVETLAHFFEESDKAKVLEIATPNEKSAATLRDYFGFLGA